MKFAFVLVFFLFKKKLLSCYAVVNLPKSSTTVEAFPSCSNLYRPYDCFAIICPDFRNPNTRQQPGFVSWACSPKLPFRVVGSNGLGPSTSRLSGVCSNQLSYEPISSFSFLRRCGGGNRVRTDDPLLAGQVLYQLSYAPIPLKKMPPRKVAPLSIKNE